MFEWKLPSSVTGHLTETPPVVLRSSTLQTALNLGLVMLSLLADAFVTAMESRSAAPSPASRSLLRVRIESESFVGCELAARIQKWASPVSASDPWRHVDPSAAAFAACA